MLIALLSDIHANREALEACLADARMQGAERYVFLGDFVGYGADPKWVIETCGNMVAAGAVAILGNHDHAVATRESRMSAIAQTAVAWTVSQLNDRELAFLASLPLTHAEADRIYIHADATAPADWNYVRSASDATRSMQASPARLTFHGHVHRPAVYALSTAMKFNSFVPDTNKPNRLMPQRRWLAVVGSVGQPRDGNPDASYAMLDDSTDELTYLRVPYNIAAAAKKIAAADLPEALAERLFRGR